MASFEEEKLGVRDYKRGAEVSNKLRSHGLTGNLVDYLICAVSIERGLSVFTTDQDFQHYAKYLPLRLHVPR